MKFFVIFSFLLLSLTVFSEVNINETIAPEGPKKIVNNKKTDKLKKLKIKKEGKEVKLSMCSKADIQKVIKTHIKQIRYCYEKELIRNPKLSGNITCSWVISETGKVLDAKVVKDTMKSKKINKCVTNMIKRCMFVAPKGKGICKIKYTFNFTSAK